MLVSWLTRPILALKYWLQAEQVSVMESAGGPLALRSLRFLSASLFSYRAAHLLIRPRHFDRSCAVSSQDPIGMSKSFREALSVSL